MVEEQRAQFLVRVMAALTTAFNKASERTAEFQPYLFGRQSHSFHLFIRLLLIAGAWVGFLAATITLSDTIVGSEAAVILVRILVPLAAAHLGCRVIGLVAATPASRLAGALLWLPMVFVGYLTMQQVISWHGKIEADKPSIQKSVWSRDLLKPPRFEYLSYGKTQPKDATKRYTTRLTKDGFDVHIAAGDTLEMEARLHVPRPNLGHIGLIFGGYAEGRSGKPKVTLYLLQKGRDPLVLDTVLMTNEVRRRYPITALAGEDARLLIKIEAASDGTDIVLDQLAVRSLPAPGSIVIQAVKTWDGKNLDGSYDEFWYDILKVDKSSGRRLRFRRVRMANGGYTWIRDLPAGEFVVRGTFHSIVLAEFGPLALDDQMGQFIRYYVPSAIRVQLHAITADGSADLPGLSIVVTANGTGGKYVRGGGGPLGKIKTDSHGRTQVWLYPTERPKDFYVVQAMRNGGVVAKQEFRLPPEEAGRAKIIVLRAKKTAMR